MANQEDMAAELEAQLDSHQDSKLVIRDEDRKLYEIFNVSYDSELDEIVMEIERA